MSTEDQLSLFAGDSPVSHSVSPGSNLARKMTVHSGLKCCELYAKWLPDGSLERMFLASSRWNSTKCYLTWKANVTPVGRLLFQLAPSMPSTDATEFGLWPTPTARDYKGGRKLETLNASGRTATNSLNDALTVLDQKCGSLNPEFVEHLMGFPIGHTDLKH